MNNAENPFALTAEIYFTIYLSDIFHLSKHETNRTFAQKR